MKKNLLILALSGLLSLGAGAALAQQPQAPAVQGGWTETADGQVLKPASKTAAKKKSKAGAKKLAQKTGAKKTSSKKAKKGKTIAAKGAAKPKAKKARSALS